MSNTKSIVPVERIERRIYLIRAHKVMLDSDLAELYGVSTGRLNEQVVRNLARFPADFMFQLTRLEMKSLRSQIAISKGRGGRRFRPRVFTEQGIAMLSGVLNSGRAVRVNIEIMRAFVRLRQIVSASKRLAAKLAELEKRVDIHDDKILSVFEAIRRLMAPPMSKRPRIGFRNS